jgi:hypothetical protein
LEQSHDVELQLGLTNRFMFAVTRVFDEPVNGDFRMSVAEVEAQYELKDREGDGVGLSLQFEYEFATIGYTPDELSFGPLFDYAAGPFLATANLFLTGQAGEAVETDAPGFEYALQAKRDLTSRWGIGVESFGEIEDLSNAGSFEDQEHYVGPMAYFSPGGNDKFETGRDEDKERESERDGPELFFSGGVLFGLTDVTSDVAFRLNTFLEL